MIGSGIKYKTVNGVNTRKTKSQIRPQCETPINSTDKSEEMKPYQGVGKKKKLLMSTQ